MQSRLMSKSDRATTPIDYLGIESCEFYDELPLWSAPPRTLATLSSAVASEDVYR